MNNLFNDSIDVILEKRKEKTIQSKFKNISDAVKKISDDFCVIDELEGIYELETDNKVHKKTVSEHTLEVVNNLENNNYYNNLSTTNKDLVKLSAYLHDIGKGPKAKWSDGIQKSYADHPADAIPMVKRILVEDFGFLQKDEIRKICLLVFYHDIIGDILEKGRSKEELYNLKMDISELIMLCAISLADISAINEYWAIEIEEKLTDFIKKEIKEICVK